MGWQIGRPLGPTSGGDPLFWDGLGIGADLMPAHLPMGVTEDGERRPEDEAETHHYICWCGDAQCPLTLALEHAWRAGRHAA